MADLNQEGVRIQVLISKEGFNDAVYFAPDEFAALDDKALEAMKDERFTNWKAFIEEQSNLPPVELTKEELAEAKMQLEEKKVLIDAEIAALDVELSK